MPMVDEQDMKILKELKKDSRLTTRQIAKKTKISSATVHRRINHLIKDGVIKQFTIEPDWKKLGVKTVAYVMLNTDTEYIKKKGLTQDTIADNLKKHHSIVTCNTITGTKDIILKVRLKDTEGLHDFINWLRNQEGVIQTETAVVLHEASKPSNLLDGSDFG